MSFKYRGLMDFVTAIVYAALILAVVGFNLWTQSTLGVLTLLLLTEIVYAFPAAFPMPLPLYLAATGINIIILATVFLFFAISEANLFHGLASLVLICIFAALTGTTTHQGAFQGAHLISSSPHCSCTSVYDGISEIAPVAAIEQS